MPLVAIEEYNEAFFVWYHARDAGWLAESDNILLHVDDHADLNLPFFREPVPPRHDLAAAARHTYTRTDIANFIWPTVYSGVFNKVYWLRRKHDARAGSWRRVTLTFAADRLPFPWRKKESFSLDPIATGVGEVACEYEPSDRLRPSATLALDIDLDYFCSNYPPVKAPVTWRIEESSAREIMESPYHWTRVEGNGCTVERDGDGRWLLTPRERAFYPPNNRIVEVDGNDAVVWQYLPTRSRAVIRIRCQRAPFACAASGLLHGGRGFNQLNSPYDANAIGDFDSDRDDHSARGTGLHLMSPAQPLSVDDTKMTKDVRLDRLGE